jgi:hypothetical protein
MVRNLRFMLEVRRKVWDCVEAGLRASCIWNSVRFLAGAREFSLLVDAQVITLRSHFSEAFYARFQVFYSKSLYACKASVETLEDRRPLGRPTYRCGIILK